MANFSQSSEYVRKTNPLVWVVGTYEGLLRRAPVHRFRQAQARWVLTAWREPAEHNGPARGRRR